MSDIVATLRQLADLDSSVTQIVGEEFFRNAADEIERLCAAKTAALKIADERAKENVSLRFQLEHYEWDWKNTQIEMDVAQAQASPAGWRPSKPDASPVRNAETAPVASVREALRELVEILEAKTIPSNTAISNARAALTNEGSPGMTEEGTKQDCMEQVVKLWNENCELRKQLVCVRRDTIEECAKFVERHQERITETERGSERSLAPRMVGNLAGVAYVDGIRALAVTDEMNR